MKKEIYLIQIWANALFLFSQTREEEKSEWVRVLFGSSGLSNTCSKYKSYCSGLAFRAAPFPCKPSGFHTDLMVAGVGEITLIWRRLVSDADRHDQPNTSSFHAV